MSASSSSTTSRGAGLGYRTVGRNTHYTNLRHHQALEQGDYYNPKPVLNNDETSQSHTRENSRSSKTRRGSRSRNNHNPRSKHQLVEKHDRIEGSDGIFASKLERDSSCGGVKEEEEDDFSGESLSRLSLEGPDSIGSEVVAEDKGKGVADAEELKNSAYESEGDENDPVKRLGEIIRFINDEAELSEELLSINNQLQEDELLAMESIYGNKMVSLDYQNGLRCFQVYINVEVPNGISVTTNFNSSNSPAERVDSSGDFSYSFKVEYLPPVTLTCVLPKSYPSNIAPIFTISVQWLNSAKISDLCHKLDSIWQEQAGQEVIYQWVEWLHDFTLSHLGFETEIVLGPYDIKDETDRRAISGCVSPNIDIPLMKSYTEELNYENFCRNIQECCICFSEYAGTEFIRMPCQHFFCLKCMKTFTDIHIKEGTVLKIQCPESKCGGMIPPSLLKRFLGNEEFERWESLMLQKTLESMSDVEYCPRCETACLKDENNHAQCSKCYYNFCTLCREKLHVGENCMTLEGKLLVLQERQNSTSIKDEQRRREANLMDQILSIREIACFTKQCPSCNMAIARTEGCNHMVCGNCGQDFCYRCGQRTSGGSHFRNNACNISQDTEIKRWDGSLMARKMTRQIEARMLAGVTSRCANCRQRIPKVGSNNHIFCSWCETYSCCSCKKIVTRKQAAQHYGPFGCPQHTP